MATVQKTVCKSNEEWRQERCHSVGASAVGILIGENPFTSPMQLAEKMRAELNGVFDYTETLAMRRGHAYEGGVAYLFECETGHKVIKASSAEYLLRRSDLPFMHASPDRTYWLDNEGPRHGKPAEQNKGILECKTTRMPIDPDDLPVGWIFQLQVQMGVSGYHKGAIAWDVLSSSNGFGYRFFDFDEEIFNAAVEVCRDFWYRCIVGGEEPDPVSVADYQRLYPLHTVGKTMTVARKTVDTLAEIKELNDAKRELEAEIDRMKDAIKMQFTDEEAMVDIDGNVLCTYKTNSKGQRMLLIK
jgi:predicted phage-related endonuclease